MESLLACGIPELHPQTLIIDVYGFGNEIDTNSWLNMGRKTCSWPVKLSKMNRFIIEVFPTDWSPSSTILHLIGLLSIFC